MIGVKLDFQPLTDEQRKKLASKIDLESIDPPRVVRGLQLFQAVAERRNVGELIANDLHFCNSLDRGCEALARRTIVVVVESIDRNVVRIRRSPGQREIAGFFGRGPLKLGPFPKNQPSRAPADQQNRSV